MAQNSKKDEDFLISEDGELISARIEPDLKKKFEDILAADERTVSSGLRLLIKQFVAEHAAAK